MQASIAQREVRAAAAYGGGWKSEVSPVDAMTTTHGTQMINPPSHKNEMRYAKSSVNHHVL
jgi:hypothetical protein